MSLPPIPDLHRSFSYRVDYVGNERQPVLIVDNFLRDAESLVEYSARAAVFDAEKGLYPGTRFPTPGIYVEAMCKHLGDLIYATFEMPKDVRRKVKSVFSMVMTPPDQLLPPQCVPHSDSAKMNDLASVHYLCASVQGGTSLYRHRATGFEYVDDSRLDEYRRVIAQQEQMPDFPKGYMNGSNHLFEQIGSYDAVFNRIIMYRCTSLHSGNIAPDFRFDPNPKTGRLTVNTFIYFPN
ncbi:MAG: DUF6445 family protein [Cellvibrio sp.]|uniref:DUF6445 family protein n=1 Tax=Cellvibrio sp. TaxID=1965322 RepID=UPI0031A5356B